MKALKIGEGTYTTNLTNDQPELLFGSKDQRKSQDGNVSPFYVSLNIHDYILHNLMLKIIMEKLGLDITRPYKDIYSFDSSKLRCSGLIKNLCVTLAQILAKSVVMDIVVANIPPKYGMLLSRSLGGWGGGGNYKVPCK